MPTYEYLCDEGHRTDFRQSMEAAPLEVCPREDCQETAERQISLGAGLLVRGKSSSEPASAGACCGPGGCGPSCCSVN